MGRFPGLSLPMVVPSYYYCYSGCPHLSSVFPAFSGFSALLLVFVSRACSPTFPASFWLSFPCAVPSFWLSLPFSVAWLAFSSAPFSGAFARRYCSGWSYWCWRSHYRWCRWWNWRYYLGLRMRMKTYYRVLISDASGCPSLRGKYQESNVDVCLRSATVSRRERKFDSRLFAVALWHSMGVGVKSPPHHEASGVRVGVAENKSCTIK